MPPWKENPGVDSIRLAICAAVCGFFAGDFFAFGADLAATFAGDDDGGRPDGLDAEADFRCEAGIGGGGAIFAFGFRCDAGIGGGGGTLAFDLEDDAPRPLEY